MSNVTIALTPDLLSKLNELDHKVRKKFSKFLRDFRANPKSASINYESISTFIDKRARTVRIGLDYRAIVVSPPKGNHHLVVYIDHHDEAMRWAQNKRFDVHPEIGALQIYDVQQATEAVERETPKSAPVEDEEELPRGPFFSFLSVPEMLRLGVPESLCDAVQKATTFEKWLALKEHLPAEAAEPLGYLVEGGFDSKDVLETFAPKQSKPADVEDFAPALQNEDSKRRFVEVNNDEEIDAILKAVLEGDFQVWRTFLHPNQRQLVQKNQSGPARILGGAGTGKTVVALHRAKYLVENVLAEGERLLFTSYSVALANEVKKQLTSLFGGVLPECVDVLNLDRWVNQYAKNEPSLQIGQLLIRGKLKNVWEKVYNEVELPDRFTVDFIMDEYHEMIEDNDLDEKGYLLRARRGRRLRLSRSDKKKMWQAAEAFRSRLAQEGATTFGDLSNRVRDHVQTLKESDRPYRCVVVDEAQDWSFSKLELIRALAPKNENDLFFVGDAHQRIFRNAVSFKSAGINIMGRSGKLRINYRSTDKICRRAIALLKGVYIDDLEGGKDDLKGYVAERVGQAPAMMWLKGPDEEEEFLIQKIEALQKEGAALREMGIIAPTWNTNHSFKRLRKHFPQVVKLKESTDENFEISDDTLRLCTLRTAKGLEFKYVFVASMGDHRWPDLPGDYQELTPKNQEILMTKQRSILFVAMTRARDGLFVSGFGKRDPLLQ